VNKKLKIYLAIIYSIFLITLIVFAFKFGLKVDLINLLFFVCSVNYSDNR
jgi:hypothetical protein